MEKYGEKSRRWHRFYRGKIRIALKAPVRSLDDFSIYYTPGVAQPCLDIKENENLVFEYTNRGNNVAIVSDGSRVLGLGNIGPKAALPVMEGKAMISKYLGDVDAFPICLNTQDEEEIIETIERISPSFGGINLEDIAQPKCFRILSRLDKKLDIFVWHDDQQGTATIVLAALINALKLCEKELSDIRLTQIGVGAAGYSVAKLLIEAGANPKKMCVVDSKGIIGGERKSLPEHKAELVRITNKENRKGGIAEALQGSDVLIALSKPCPGTITRQMIETMSKGPIVFALANPVPEILPEEALKAGAKVVATGRSDYPNQVNNSLVFPAILRGALDVHAKTINQEMMVAAAKTIACFAEKQGLSPSHIVPAMTDYKLYPLEAAAVAKAAMDTNVHRVNVDPEWVRINTDQRVKRYHKIREFLFQEGLVSIPRY
ncbi:MAG: NAD(P)-dependent malic enzyme [Candidatus Ranarchaeia archaeon]